MSLRKSWKSFRGSVTSGLVANWNSVVAASSMNSDEISNDTTRSMTNTNHSQDLPMEIFKAKPQEEYLQTEMLYDISPEQRDMLYAMMGRRNLDNMDTTDTEMEYMIQVIFNLSEEEAVAIIKKALQDHKDDPNFPSYQRRNLEDLIQSKEQHIHYSLDDRSYNLKMEAALIHYHSPYPEVRSIADPMDDPNLPVETVRAYLLGIIWVIIGTGVNQFFEPRMPPISITSHLLQFLVYPCGRLLELLPDYGFTVRGRRISLNPGPWNSKEQALVTIMFGITASMAYVSDQIFVQRLPVFYNNNDWARAGYQFTLIMSTQFIGFGLAGLVRHILVYPVQCIWPSVMPTLALNKAMFSHDRKEVINGWSISRYRFFMYSFLAMFVYFWFPSFLFQALSTFNWITWFSPQNFKLATITGSITGLGINPWPTFDWNIVSSLIAPLNTPFFAIANNYLGTLLAGACVIPAIYFTNLYYTGYLPINSSRLFTNKGEEYEVTKILTNNVLDHDKYQSYSLPFYSAANLVVYGAFFALYPALIVHAALYHRETLWKGVTGIWTSIKAKERTIDQFTDAHSRMMAQYDEVPLWWFLAVSTIAIVIGIVCVEVYPTQTPVWSIFFGLAIGTIFLIPIGLLYSVTNFSLSLNVLTELIAGYALPGRGIALMIVKAFGLNTNVQAIYFIQDQKLGYYAKVPPRATFRSQIIATFFQALVVLGVANWQIRNYAGICTTDQPDNFTCPNESVYYSASVIWGVIGPRRVFEGLYPVFKWCFLIGAILPVPFYLAQKYLTKWSIFSNLDCLIIILGFLNYAPYNLSYFTTAFYVSFIFMCIIRRYYVSWFEKYTYILAAGLSAGLALSGIIIFFAVQYKPVTLSWWGNDKPTAGIDGDESYRMLPLPDVGYFGPAPGSYP